MALVEDTTKTKSSPNFSDGELAAIISMVTDNKILLLGINKIPICATYRSPLVNHLLSSKSFTSLNNQQNLCKSSIYNESIFATKGVGHYLAYP